MQNLCKDIIWLIGFKLDNQSLLYLSISCKKLYTSIFLSDLFWQIKCRMEYPSYFFLISNKGVTKEIYSNKYVCETISKYLGIEEKEGIYHKEEIIIRSENITLPKNIKVLPFLKSIRISNNCLSSFPSFIFIQKIQKLNLSYNYISEIPSNILILNNLKELNLSDNMIRSFPKELCLLSRLQKLDLSNNSINNIPNEIYKLINLEFLDLSKNYIIHVPIELSLLNHLKVLSLSHNYIEKFPKELRKLELDEVYLSHNKLSSLKSSQKIVSNVYS